METKVKKPKEPKVETPKLVSYTMKAVIPTGPYANIQPEIVVTAKTIEEASAMVMPYIDQLFVDYLNLADRARPKVTMVVREEKEEKKPVNVGESEASKKARTAIETCNSVEALDLIAERVARSEKLTALEKLDLKMPIATKRTKLSQKKDDFRATDTEPATATEEVPVVEPA
jgi:hypothetical protein